jgi:thiosulfate/3-mercaptopyruvate sulfurtransferase
VLLTRRNDALRHHGGQVSFPGGRIESGDANARCTRPCARRTRKSALLPRRRRRWVTSIPLLTITGFRVQPACWLIQPDFVPRPIRSPRSPRCSKCRWSLLLDPVNWNGSSCISADGRATCSNTVTQPQRIWGVTASILYNLRERLAPATHRENLMAGWTTLVQAETWRWRWIAPTWSSSTAAFRLLDPNCGEQAYSRSHLPGRYAHLERDLSEMGPHGDGRHPWPQAEVLVSKLRRWGIDARSQVIAYDDGDGAYAARLWFLLRMLGHEKVAVLDGGWARWTALGLPVSSSPHQGLPSRYEADFDAFAPGRCATGRSAPVRWRHLGRRARTGALPWRGRADRPRRRPCARGGQSPFATNLVDGRFKSPMQLGDEFRALLDGRDPSRVVVMCGSGVTACHNLLAMERAGLKGAKLYTGSWSGWIQDPSRPVAKGS